MRDCHGLTGTHDVAPAVNVALRLPAEVSGQKPSAVYDVRMDPAAMREQARQLRDGAATVRQKGAALDDGIRAVHLENGADDVEARQKQAHHH